MIKVNQRNHLIRSLRLFPGVGKTSLVHLIAHNEALISPGWTIGCSAEVKIHEYREGTASQQTFFIELFDIGGSMSHKNTRGVFYNPTNGIILVHDLTNRKSHENLQRWLYEMINKDGKDINRANSENDFDPEYFLGSTQVSIGQLSDFFYMFICCLFYFIVCGSNFFQFFFGFCQL